MGPFTPQTPGTSYSPYAQPSPSPGSYSGNLHLYTCISDLLKSSLCQDGCWIKMTTILEVGCLKRKTHSLDLQHGHRQAVSTCTSKLGQWKTIYWNVVYSQLQVQVLGVLHPVPLDISHLPQTPPPHLLVTVQWLLVGHLSPQGLGWTKVWLTGTPLKSRSKSKKHTMTTSWYTRQA